MERKCNVVAWAELGLEGTLKSVGQALRAIYAAWTHQAEALVLPEEDRKQAIEKLNCLMRSRLLSGHPPQLIFARNLNEAVSFVHEIQSLPNKRLSSDHSFDSMGDPVDQTIEMKEKSWKGRTLPEWDPYSGSDPIDRHERLLPLAATLERILGISVSGRHHLLLIGPKGAGKSQALAWFEALQPEADDQTKIRQSLIAELHSPRAELVRKVPIRRIGTQVRAPALVGRIHTSGIRPGEFSLAHGGALVADEFPEWSRDAREALREPLESGMTSLTRAAGSIALPARFQLAANGNFCPCGGIPPEFPIPEKNDRSASETERLRCTCTHRARQDYLHRLSGPILDRVDLILPLFGLNSGSSSAKKQFEKTKKRILAARKILRSLWGELPGELEAFRLQDLIRDYPQLEDELDQQDRLCGGLSLRSRHKLLRLALTLSVWDATDSTPITRNSGSTQIKLQENYLPQRHHFMEAALYRPEAFHLQR